MRKLVRDVRELVERSGGSAVAIEEGSKHTMITFRAPGGIPGLVRLHKGTNPKRYAEKLRSDLRRQGLRL